MQSDPEENSAEPRSHAGLICLRDGRREDDPFIQELFRRAAIQGGSASYSEEALRVWSQGFAPDRWPTLLASEEVVVAELQGRVVGFATLKANECLINLVYTHPDCFRQGIGRLMINELEKRAARALLTRLKLTSSLNAVQFYEACGYRKVSDETVFVRGSFFEVWHMEKELDLASNESR